jgi:hypothetical protein
LLIIIIVAYLLRIFQDALPFQWSTIVSTLLLILAICVGCLVILYLFRQKPAKDIA